jgi:hypothetical protein
MHRPMRVDGDAWAETVNNAIRIAEQGWAEKALALGWSALDLFGGVADAEGDPYCDGLAVWLRGPRILALTAEGAIAEDGPRSRSYFLPCRPPGAKLLWELGR